jgi:hypothetical protein
MSREVRIGSSSPVTTVAWQRSVCLR